MYRNILVVLGSQIFNRQHGMEADKMAAGDRKILGDQRLHIYFSDVRIGCEKSECICECFSFPTAYQIEPSIKIPNLAL